MTTVCGFLLMTSCVLKHFTNVPDEHDGRNCFVYYIKNNKNNMSPSLYKYCVVPLCKSTVKSTPGKLFFHVPTDTKIRKKWMNAMRRARPIGPKTTGHCCEDHFDVENDVENYMKYKLLGCALKIKNDVVPHYFTCQNRRKKPERSSVLNANSRAEIVADAIAATSPHIEHIYVVEPDSTLVDNTDIELLPEEHKNSKPDTPSTQNKKNKYRYKYSKMGYKGCVVPQCSNTSIKTPEKLFLSIPKNTERRRKWLMLARINPKDIAATTSVSMCEDHFDTKKDIVNYTQYKMGFSQTIVMAKEALPSKFDCQTDLRKRVSENTMLRLNNGKRFRSDINEKPQAAPDTPESNKLKDPLQTCCEKGISTKPNLNTERQLPNDMENYCQYKLMGSVSKIRMKPDCLPSKFQCQPDRIKRTAPLQPRSAVCKRQRMNIIQEIVSKMPAISGMTSKSDFWSATENDDCSSFQDQVTQPQAIFENEDTDSNHSTASIDTEYVVKLEMADEESSDHNKDTPRQPLSLSRKRKLEEVSFTARGIVPPVFTPLNDDGTVNFLVIPSYAQYLADAGIKAVLVGGTTGENMSLSVDDRKRIVDEWMSASQSTGLHIMVQVGGAPMADVLSLTRYCQDAGVHSLLTLPDLYFKPQSVDELVSYVELVANAAPQLPVLYYHIPSMSKVEINMPQFVTAATERIPTFRGIKFTSNDLSEAAQVLRNLVEGQEIFLGADTLLAPAALLGITSSIGTTFNMLPELGQQILRAVEDNDVPRARQLQEKLSLAVEAHTCEGAWVPIMKAGMEIMTDIKVGPPSLPQKPISDEAKVRIAEKLSNLGLVDIKPSSPS